MKKPNHRKTRVLFIKKPHRLLRHVSSARKKDLENLVHGDQQPNTTVIRHKHWRTLSPMKKPEKELDPGIMRPVK